jgi:RNA polymerase sigma-70 factor (ECF subfamily)
MPDDASQTEELLRRAGAGDQQALVELFARHRDRLRRMVRLRLDRRLQGRVDPSEVLQEGFLEVCRQAAEYVAAPSMPVYLWLRSLTGQRLLAVHRRHLGAQTRDSGQEVSLYRGALPQASSLSLAAQLLGRLTTQAQTALRAEMQIRLQEALNSMDPLDREVLTLRHFEELSNSETATVLGIPRSAASDHYLRALKRLKEILAGLPGFFDS